MECPKEQRIEVVKVVRRHSEAGGVPDALEASDVAPSIRPTAVVAGLLGRTKNVAGGRSPPTIGRRADQIATFGYSLPELLRAERAGQYASASHNRDRREHRWPSAGLDSLVTVRPKDQLDILELGEQRSALVREADVRDALALT